MNALIICLVLLLLAVNTSVTVLVSKTPFLERRQMLAQSIVIWLLPFVGAILIAVFLFSNREQVHQRSQHDRDENDQWTGGDGLHHHGGDHH